MSKKSKSNGRGFLKPYKTYMFREKDPVIDEIRTMKADYGMTNVQIANASGLASGTLGNWFKGSTRRPQNASVEAAGRAMGKKRVWVDNVKRK